MSDKVKKMVVFDQEQHNWLDNQAFANKRAGIKELDSISKIVRRAVEEYRGKKAGN